MDDLDGKDCPGCAAKGGRLMSRLMGFVFVACLLSHPSFGADSDKVIGTWKLVSYETEIQASGTKEPALGQNPLRCL